MTKKRLFSALLILSLLVSTLSMAAVAVESRASKTLLGYNAIITQGSSSGVVEVTYDVEANRIADQVGVATLKIYREKDDVCVATFNGTVSNGLIREDASCHRSTKSWTGVSGTYYYAVLTVTATIGSDTDTRDFTTSSVKAP